jgi:hypothetical protein
MFQNFPTKQEYDLVTDNSMLWVYGSAENENFEEESL